MAGKKYTESLLSALFLLQVHLSLAQFEGCPMISDPDTLARLVSDTISPDDTISLSFSVVLLRNHTVCLSVGPEAGTVSGISLLIEYECTPAEHPVCAVVAANSSSVGRSVAIEQFDFGCAFIDDGYHWTAEQFGKTGSHAPMADFDTALRTDCSMCIEEGVAEILGLQQLLPLDPVTRCLACSAGCAPAGMGRCFGVGNTMCCNYFSNSSCVNLCPHTTQPDSNYNCQRVVVGFEEKVYMVEEGQARLKLPVVVKEGQLTQRVVLLVTINDRTTTVGMDYQVYNRRVQLIPRAGVVRGQVHIEIFDDSLLEDNEEFVVNLELKPGSSAAIDISSAIVLIMEDQEEPTNDTTENETMATTQTTPTPTTPIENGCEPEFDGVWGLQWPRSAQRTTASVSCGQNNRGTATRKCLVDAVWAPANVSLCENQHISKIREMAKELFSQPHVQVEDALVVMRELAEAASNSAAANMSQLPRDLVTASDIVARTVDLLLLSAAGNGSNRRIPLKEVNINETVVVVDVLSLLLTEQNKVGFSSLQDMGSPTGSQAILYSAERYSLYVGQTLVEDGTNPGHLMHSRDSLVLVSQRRSSEDLELGSRTSDVTFPRTHELRNIVSEQKPPAVITIPGTLLRDQFKGNVSVTSLFFRDLHNLLPTNLSNGSAPRSFVITSEIYGTPEKPSGPLVFEDTPIKLTFRVELNDTNEVPKCVFWDFSKGVEESGWSTAGLRTESVATEGDTVTITCSSSHLTSFSVLVDVGGARIVDKSLEIVSYIGISISIACLFLTIIFFVSIGKKLFSTVHNFIHLNLSISLFVAYVIFAVGIEVATSNQSACIAVAALIQYFLLSAFCWMMCEGIMLYLMLVVVFSRISEKWWFFLLLGWGIPLIFVVIGLSTVLDEYGVRDSDGDLLYCWLSSGDGKHAIWTFVAPMLGIIAVNSVFLVLVLRSIYISKSGQDSRNKKGQKRHSLARYIVKASLILLPLLGLTWVFGLFAVNENTAVFAWLFTIFNSLQGVSIFAFHVLRNDRVWGRFRKSMMDPDGFLRSFSSRRTTRSSIGVGSSRFSRPCESEMEMKSHGGPISATSGLASSSGMVPPEDVFEPREDTPTSSSTGEPALESTTCDPRPNGSNGIHTETNNNGTMTKSSSGTIGSDPTGSLNESTNPNNASHDDGHTTNGNGISSGIEESGRTVSSGNSEFSYEQLCEDIATAIDIVTRKLSNST